VDSRLKKHPLGYWEIENKPTTQELQKFYAEKYYQEGLGSYAPEYTNDELNYFNAKLEQRSAVLHRYILSVNDTPRFLDVGCGEGYTLEFFRRKGWIITGFDFSRAGIESKNPACIDALVTGDIFNLLEAEVQAEKNYDVVWLQNVLEHVIDPLALLKSLRTLVKSGGMAVVTVPNDCSIAQNELLILGHIEQAFWVSPPEHLSYFDSKSLISISNATGWDVCEILADFPVDWFLFNQKSNYVHDNLHGKSAHKARMQIENMIQKQPLVDVVSFYSALAKIGLGRNITAFLRPAPSK
jgi:2-polyprenyl-3-methyl-5-hydroxy-6-metoxy-1,4-benzoquinol methylase